MHDGLQDALDGGEENEGGFGLVGSGSKSIGLDSPAEPDGGLSEGLPDIESRELSARLIHRRSLSDPEQQVQQEQQSPTPEDRDGLYRSTTPPMSSIGFQTRLVFLSFSTQDGKHKFAALVAEKQPLAKTRNTISGQNSGLRALGEVIEDDTGGIRTRPRFRHRARLLFRSEVGRRAFREVFRHRSSLQGLKGR